MEDDGSGGDKRGVELIVEVTVMKESGKLTSWAKAEVEAMATEPADEVMAEARVNKRAMEKVETAMVRRRRRRRRRRWCAR